MLALRRGYERVDRTVTEADRKLQTIDRHIARDWRLTRAVAHELTREERVAVRRGGNQQDKSDEDWFATQTGDEP